MVNNNEIPQAVVVKQKGFNPIWILPIIAISIGVWLLYKQVTEADIPIRITFPTGEGIIVGKTEVRFQGIAIGVVEELTVSPDLENVVAHVEMDRSAKQAMVEGTVYWLVKPQIGIKGVSALDTLMTGNYISVKPNLNGGAPAFDFIALNEAPVLNEDSPGKRFTLRAPRQGSISKGSPVFYRQVEVGEVISHQLEDESVKIVIHVDPEFEHLVHENTRFWSSSGLDFSGSLSGFKVSVESLTSLLVGGISFGSPKDEEPSPVAAEGHEFSLYEDFDDAEAGLPIKLNLNSADGLVAGVTEVRYKGIKAGYVSDIDINENYSGVVATLIFDPSFHFAMNDTTRFWVVRPGISLSGISGLSTLLSGSYLEFDFQESSVDKTEFAVLDSAPFLDKTSAGLHIILQAKELGGVSQGMPVMYMQLPIGRVHSYRLANDNSSLLLDVFIEQKYAHLVSKNSRFYNASGVRINGSISGFNLQVESLTSLLRGGIGVYTPSSKAAKASSGDVFNLAESRDAAMEEGHRIHITFANGDGLRVGTQIRHLGIEIGRLVDVGLADDLGNVRVEAKIESDAVNLIRDKTRFWVARPEVKLNGTRNLETLVSGVFIKLDPGKGNIASNFRGLDDAPSLSVGQPGLKVVLLAPRLASVKQGAPVRYRDIKVGDVQSAELADDARNVEIHIKIEQKYATLVRPGTRFWNTSGIGVEGGLFKGLEIRTGSLEEVMTGGISFATPTAAGGTSTKTVAEGSRFTLHAEADPEWLEWQPSISIEK